MAEISAAFCRSSTKMTRIGPRERGQLSSPYYLLGTPLFAAKGRREVFVKRIKTTARRIPQRGAVVMAPGIACNGNLFRMTTKGTILNLDHDRSFANLLASWGFAVYLWHYPSSERVYNRFVTRFCSESLYHGAERYTVPPTLNFDQMVNLYFPMVLDLVGQDARTDQISWVGFSMGGMLAYAYLAKHDDARIQNLVTIGSPIRITLSLARVIAYANLVSKILGTEEHHLTGIISNRLHWFAGLLAYLPGTFLKIDPLVDFIYNPDNVSPLALKSFFARVVEPIPSGLEDSFSHFVREGFVSLSGDCDYYDGLRRSRTAGPDCLFIAGGKDKLAPPKSVRLAQQALTPDVTNSLIVLPDSGHNDLIFGQQAETEVWTRVLNWLVARAPERDNA